MFQYIPSGLKDLDQIYHDISCYNIQFNWTPLYYVPVSLSFTLFSEVIPSLLIMEQVNLTRKLYVNYVKIDNYCRWDLIFFLSLDKDNFTMESVDNGCLSFVLLCLFRLQTRQNGFSVVKFRETRYPTAETFYKWDVSNKTTRWRGTQRLQSDCFMR